MFTTLKNAAESVSKMFKRTRKSEQSHRSRRQPPRMTRDLTVENLEERELFATGLIGLTPLNPVLHNGVLTVMGSTSADTITVTKSNTRIVVLGQSFDASQVRSIAIDGEDGNDTITVSDLITTSTYLYGGGGNDTITGGSGRDRIFGGWGNDRLLGRGGNDYLYGGLGDDYLDGGTGINLTQGMKGMDTSRNPTQSIGVSGDYTAYSGTTYMGQVLNEIVRLVNRERTSRGLAALTYANLVNTVAYGHAKSLAALQVPVGQGISHAFSGTTGPTLGARLDRNLVEWNACGENNASVRPVTQPQARSLAAQVMNLWMNSSGHRANILKSQFTQIGVGMAGNATSGYYFTQVFVRPAS